MGLLDLVRISLNPLPISSDSRQVNRTLCIAGKGVTYDVGGADIKVGGSMAGMRRGPYVPSISRKPMVS